MRSLRARGPARQAGSQAELTDQAGVIFPATVRSARPIADDLVHYELDLADDAPDDLQFVPADVDRCPETDFHEPQMRRCLREIDHSGDHLFSQPADNDSQDS